VVARLPEALIAYSCDKNFGLYRDRVGALYMLTPDAAQTTTPLSNATRWPAPTGRCRPITARGGAPGADRSG
jgi:hypothetical protein